MDYATRVMEAVQLTRLSLLNDLAVVLRPMVRSAQLLRLTGHRPREDKSGR